MNWPYELTVLPLLYPFPQNLFQYRNSLDMVRLPEEDRDRIENVLGLS